MSGLLRSPRVWALVVIAVIILGQSVALHFAERKISALKSAHEQEQLDAIAQGREEALEQQADDLAARAVLERQVDDLKATSKIYAAETARLAGALALQQAAGKKLVETGTVDDVVRFGQQLGLHPVAR